MGLGFEADNIVEETFMRAFAASARQAYDTHFIGYEVIGGGNTSAPSWTTLTEPLTVQLLSDGCYP